MNSRTIANLGVSFVVSTLAACGGSSISGPGSDGTASAPGPKIALIRIETQGGSKIVSGLDSTGAEVSRLRLDEGADKLTSTYTFSDGPAHEATLVEVQDWTTGTTSLVAQTRIGNFSVARVTSPSAKDSATLATVGDTFGGHLNAWARILHAKPHFVSRAINGNLRAVAAPVEQDRVTSSPSTGTLTGTVETTQSSPGGLTCALMAAACQAAPGYYKAACLAAVALACAGGGGPSNDDKQTACNANCTATGHAYGSYDPVSGSCACSTMTTIPPGGCAQPPDCDTNPNQCGCPYVPPSGSSGGGDDTGGGDTAGGGGGGDDGCGDDACDVSEEELED
jgi:hypothetical protein